MADLNAMAVPRKYRELGDFHEYYSGRRTAPYLTMFIGGNHEASNHLMELYYGGWVAPKIYYFGAANVIRCGPLRIGGVSGIWKGYNYRKAHYERLPYSEDDLRSVYHVRELDVRKLLQIRTQVDVGLSHDWPQGVEWKGDWRGLFRFKKHLESDAKKNHLGSPAAKYLIDHLRPPYWFSAHLHCKYSAIIRADARPTRASGKGHDSHPAAPATNGSTSNANADEIDIDLDSGDEAEPKRPGQAEEAAQAKEAPTGVSEDLRARLPDSFKAAKPAIQAACPDSIDNTETKFLALDKCLPNRKFLQLLEIRSERDETEVAPASSGLFYDKEWLAITRVFANELQVGKGASVPRDRGASYYRPLILSEEDWVESRLVQEDRMKIPENFVQTAPPQASNGAGQANAQPQEYQNPQTGAFCELLGINIFQTGK